MAVGLLFEHSTISFCFLQPPPPRKGENITKFSEFEYEIFEKGVDINSLREELLVQIKNTLRFGFPFL